MDNTAIVYMETFTKEEAEELYYFKVACLNSLIFNCMSKEFDIKLDTDKDSMWENYHIYFNMHPDVLVVSNTVLDNGKDLTTKGVITDMFICHKISVNGIPFDITFTTPVADKTPRHLFDDNVSFHIKIGEEVLTTSLSNRIYKHLDMTDIVDFYVNVQEILEGIFKK